MTYTPAPGQQPDKRTDQRNDKLSKPEISKTGLARKPGGSLKESHLRNFQQSKVIPASQTRPDAAPFRAQSPATHRFGISVLLDDGSISHLDHFAPMELYLEDVCACFARGSLIATVNGHVAVEDLQPGDRIKTRDAGEQVLRWKSCCTLPTRDSEAAQELTLRIKADALGELRPIQDLVVSPRFRLLTNHPSCEALFGSPETLAPAVDLLDGDTILQVRPAPGLEFFNLMFDNHQIIEANGLETESYHPGNFGVAVMSLEMQSHLRQIFPHLNGDLNKFGRSARPILKGFEAEVLRVG